MKKLLLILLIIVISLTSVISISCAKSKLSGTYEGTLPAADGPGLQTLIAFNSDGTFHMEETFLEKDVEPRITNGKWVLNGDIYLTIVTSTSSYDSHYKVKDGKAVIFSNGVSTPIGNPEAFNGWVD